MRILRYGGGRGRRVVYMLYTGQHYDPLLGPPPENKRTFPPSAEAPKASAAREEAALQLASDHNHEAARLARERSMPAGSMPSP